MDWLDLLAVQGTLKSLLQHRNSEASFLQCSGFFVAHFSYPYTTTRKIIVLTVWAFVSEMISLLFNTLFRFVIAFLPRSKCLLISWLQSPSAVILDPKKIKSVTASTFSFSICYEVMGPDAMILFLSFLTVEIQASFFTLLFHPPQEALWFLFIAIRMVSFAYLRLLIFLLTILIPLCDSSSLEIHMMYSAFK